MSASHPRRSAFDVLNDIQWGPREVVTDTEGIWESTVNKAGRRVARGAWMTESEAYNQGVVLAAEYDQFHKANVIKLQLSPDKHKYRVVIDLDGWHEIWQQQVDEEHKKQERQHARQAQRGAAAARMREQQEERRAQEEKAEEEEAAAAQGEERRLTAALQEHGGLRAEYRSRSRSLSRSRSGSESRSLRAPSAPGTKKKGKRQPKKRKCRCHAQTRDKKRCLNRCVAGSEYCSVHRS